MIGTGNNQTFPSPAQIACPKCKQNIKLVTHDRAFGFGCNSCGSFSEIKKDGTATTVQSYHVYKKATFKPGTIFTIEEKEFVLLNYLVKQELAYNTTWTEYTLFHPTEGFRVLNESEGHYTLVKPVRFYLNGFENARKVVIPKHGEFDLYSRYKYKIKHAEGEFLSNFIHTPLSASADFVNPPFVASYEATKESVNWYLGEYHSQKTVQSWVKEKIDFPLKDGVAPHQPFILNFKLESLYKLSGLAVALLFLVQIILSTAVTTSKTSLNQGFAQKDSTGKSVFVSDTFRIQTNNCATDVELEAPMLGNNWVEADVTLVNETTGDQYYFGQAIEYYSGYDGGESWSEGDRKEVVTISSIKSGRYHINLELTNEAIRPYNTFTVTVIENVTLISNFFITLLCIIIVPVSIYFLKRRFDRKQWYNSDYSPYDYGDNED